MRVRIESFLGRLADRTGGPPGIVMVFGGAVTSEARKAGGIDDRIRLRSFTRKTRLDRRHHAIDAAVLTSLGMGVAKTLRERSALRRDDQLTGKEPGWKDYRGAQPGDQDTFAQWRERVGVLAGLLHDDIAGERVPVVRPLRLAPRFGSIHADTVEPLHRRHVQDAFTQDEVLRVVDRRLFAEMSALAEGGDLPADPGRAALLRWDPGRPVELFPSNAAYLAVRGGAVPIGGSARYAQVFAWPTKDAFAFGMVRLFAGEFPRIGFGGPGNDFLATAPPPDSQAMRACNPVLRRRIQSGEARWVGWLALDDEIEIDPDAFPRDDSKLGRFLAHAPERTWTLTGFFTPVQISIAPALLAFEGVVTADQQRPGARPTEPPTPPEIATVLKDNRIPMSVNVVLGARGTAVIRRTVLGRPRWTGDALPCSWHPQEAAERAFQH